MGPPRAARQRRHRPSRIVFRKVETQRFSLFAKAFHHPRFSHVDRTDRHTQFVSQVLGGAALGGDSPESSPGAGLELSADQFEKPAKEETPHGNTTLSRFTRAIR